MNTTTKYSMNTYQDYAYVFYYGNNALKAEDVEDEPQAVVMQVEDYSNTNFLGLPKDFKLNGY